MNSDIPTGSPSDTPQGYGMQPQKQRRGFKFWKRNRPQYDTTFVNPVGVNPEDTSQPYAVTRQESRQPAPTAPSELKPIKVEDTGHTPEEGWYGPGGTGVPGMPTSPEPTMVEPIEPKIKPTTTKIEDTGHTPEEGWYGPGGTGVPGMPTIPIVQPVTGPDTTGPSPTITGPITVPGIVREDPVFPRDPRDTPRQPAPSAPGNPPQDRAPVGVQPTIIDDTSMPAPTAPSELKPIKVEDTGHTPEEGWYGPGGTGVPGMPTSPEPTMVEPLEPKIKPTTTKIEDTGHTPEEGWYGPGGTGVPGMPTEDTTRQQAPATSPLRDDTSDQKTAAPAAPAIRVLDTANPPTFVSPTRGDDEPMFIPENPVPTQHPTTPDFIGFKPEGRRPAPSAPNAAIQDTTNGRAGLGQQQYISDVIPQTEHQKPMQFIERPTTKPPVETIGWAPPHGTSNEQLTSMVVTPPQRQEAMPSTSVDFLNQPPRQ